MNIKNKKVVKWVLIFSVLILLLFIYKVFNPIDYQYFPKCPVKTITGLDCAGCGSQRAIHHLLNFNIKQAFRENALVVIFIPYLITAFIFDFIKSENEKFLKWRKILFGQKAIYTIIVIIVLFTIIRNII